MSVVIRQNLAICTSVSAQENVPCANGYITCKYHLRPTAFLCSACRQHLPELISLHQKAKPQHSTTAHSCFSISSTPPAETLRQQQALCQGSGQDWEGEGSHQLNTDTTSPTKIQGKTAGKHQELPIASLKAMALFPLLIWRCTCIQAQKFLGGTTGWLGEEETI